MTALLVILFFVLAVPIVIVGAVVGGAIFLMVQVLALPFRLLGWTVGVGAGLILAVIKLFLLALLGMFLMLGLLVGLAPLLPLVVVCLGIWLVSRAARPRRAQGARSAA